MDEYHSSTASNCHATYMNYPYKFHDPTNAYPDWIIKHCYLVIIAAVMEADVGVENLFKKGIVMVNMLMLTW
jgi:hypothetical protein